ncbi:hypothetical protein ABLE68_06870 [Nocardioides sp. CN2-186]|uniref:calcium-binding protein n=1 Tax=Nocardioides tweenelious TaxID=3156607 RepID=UPI0032B52724
MSPYSRACLAGIPGAAALAMLPSVLLSPAEAATPTCHGARATIEGTSGPDHLVGTSHRDVIVGLGGDDTLAGLGGNDLLCGGTGDDHLIGGPGDDQLYGQLNRPATNQGFYVYDGDTLEGGPGDDLLDQGTETRSGSMEKPSRDSTETFSWINSTTAVHVDLAKGVATGEGHDTLVLSKAPVHITTLGSRHDDVIRGSREKDVIYPEDGDDLVHAGGGRDIVSEFYPDFAGDGPTGDDRVYGDGGHDLIDLREGDDEGHGGPGPDEVDTRGQGEMHGGRGDDGLLTDGGNAVLKGDGGDDLMVVRGWDATHLVEGGTGTDSLRLGARGSEVHADLAAERVTVDGVTGAVTGVDGPWWVEAPTGQTVSVHGTDGADEIRLTTLRYDESQPYDDFTVTTGGGSDRVIAGAFHSVTLATGAGDDRASFQSPNDITVHLGVGDDTVATHLSFASDLDRTAQRSYDGGPGRDTADLHRYPGDSCTSIERGGGCPP